MYKDNYLESIENKMLSSAQGLRNGIRQQIFQYLIERNTCSFNELLGYLKVPRPKLAYHLQILLKYNIINNFYDKREGIKDHSFYELSSFGRELLVGFPQDRGLNLMLRPEDQAKNRELATTNFRTIRHVEYKSSKDIQLKISKNSIKPVKNKARQTFNPFLNCYITTKTKTREDQKKVDLPSVRKQYLSYKQSFRLKEDGSEKD